jgi:uncharacterized membrane protein
MATFQLLLTFAFGLFMVANGYYHFSSPTMYYPFIPDFLPKKEVNIGAGIVEILVGISVFIPQFRIIASQIILGMMVAFLVLHTLDVFKAQPAIGSHKTAIQRLLLQVVLVAWAWLINR